MTTPLPRTRESYAGLGLYTPDRRPCAIDVSDNTNLWGMPPAAERAMRDAPTTSVTRYPDAYAHTLKRALAAYAGVDPACIVTGCGSDDVLDSAIRAFGEPGAILAMPDPSFAMIPAFARMNALEPVLVPLTNEYDVDADRMSAADAAIVYLCSPNNPTGVPFARASIESVLSRTGGLVIIDEAYAEFAGGSATDLAVASNRALVVRTMSKAFGLAGLRVGYAIGAPALVAEVEKSRGPYKVDAVAQRAAIAALGDGLAWVRERIEAVAELRGRFGAALQTLGITPLPSRANFVLAPLPNAAPIAAAMRARGVAVRPFNGLCAPAGTPLAMANGNAIRMTIGPWPMLERVLDVLAEAMRQCA